MKENIVAKLTPKDDKYACSLPIKLYRKVRKQMNGTNILMTLLLCSAIQNHSSETKHCIFLRQMLSGTKKIALILFFLIFLLM